METERERVERIATDAFRASGLTGEDAALVANVLVTADASGKRSHGLLRLPRYVRGIDMTNTEAAMPPFGGTEPILGTNPIAIGLPTDPPFNLDMSASSIARGTLLQKRSWRVDSREGRT